MTVYLVDMLIIVKQKQYILSKLTLLKVNINALKRLEHSIRNALARRLVVLFDAVADATHICKVRHVLLIMRLPKYLAAN